MQDKNIQKRTGRSAIVSCSKRGRQVAIFSGGTSVGSPELSRAGWPPVAHPVGDRSRSKPAILADWGW